MNILIAHNDYAKFSGEENAVRVMSEVLAANGHTIHWFRRTSADIGNSLPRQIHALFSGIYSIRSRNCIETMLDSQDIDIVQVQNLYPFLSPSILPACRKRNIPVVMRCPNYRLFCPNGLHLLNGKVCERCLGGREWNCILHNCEASLPKSIGYAARNAFARKTRMILDNITVFIVLSEFQKRRFMDGGIPKERLSILPNVSQAGVAVETGRPGNLVTFAGRVSPEKGIHEFIEAARRLPGLSFAVAGDTTALPDIESGAPGNVDFRGFLEGDAFRAIYRDSRILVFPSKWFEGFPNVIALAMAFGKPVIAARIGAVPEIVEDGVTGLLFEPGNGAELAEKIDYLWNRPDLCRQMGRAGTEKAQREYSESRYYETLMGIYSKAAALCR